MIHIAICDDEKDFVTYLTGLLQRYAAETGKEIKVTAYYDGMELIEKYDPPLLRGVNYGCQPVAVPMPVQSADPFDQP